MTWLALRESADRRARSKALLAALGDGLARRSQPLIVDLGAGSGALRRALAGVAPPDARWRLIDREPSLLALAHAADPTVETVAAELSSADLAPLVSGADCVAATAFFDLVSEAWIERMVRALPPGALVYAALTYDGRESWRPAHAADRQVLEAFRAHQRGDAGFGPALGPDAAEALADHLSAAGWRVQAARAPWRLTRSRDGALMAELAGGIARDVASAAPGVDAAAWRAAVRDTAEIGHWDLLASPA